MRTIGLFEKARRPRAALRQYRTRHTGWTVKHFHDLATTASARPPCWCRQARPHRRRRPRMRRHDRSRHEWRGGVRPDRTTPPARSIRPPVRRKAISRSSSASHYFHTPEAGGKVAKDQHTQVGRALHQLSTSLPWPEARGRSERAFGTPAPRKGTGVGGECDGRSRKPLHRRHLPARPAGPNSKTAALPRTPRPDRARSPATTPCATKGASSRSPRARHHYVKARAPGPRVSRRPSSTGPDASPATPPTAEPIPQPGKTLRRDRGALWTIVDSRSAPPLPHRANRNNRSGHMMCSRTNPLARQAVRQRYIRIGSQARRPA